MIYGYNKQYRFADLTHESLRNYSVFEDAMKSFIRKFGLDQFSNREIDVFLWLKGKEQYGKL